MQQAKTLRGAILDVDGTLLDSNEAHSASWHEALQRELAREYPLSDIRKLIGMGGDKFLPTLTGIEEKTPLGKKISETRKKIFKEKYIPVLSPFPKMRELLEKMKESGLKLAIATSASEEDLEAMLKILKIDDLLEAEVSKDDAKKSKPDPDGIQKAFQKLHLAPDQVLMLGDTPYDIEAAARAGVKTVALNTWIWGEDQLSDAIAIYRNCEDLLLRFSSSPFAKN